MADDNAIELIKRGDKRFSDRQTLDSLRHEIALNFAPQHAAWVSPPQLGDDFASHLVDGAPLVIADDFIGMIRSMLRPEGKQWSWHRTPHEHLNENPKIRSYLDWRSRQMFRITFDRVTGADSALAEADEFYGLFGDAVIMCDYADNSRSRLRIQHFHSKDATWAIGADNKPDVITRKEAVPARVVVERFRQRIDKVHRKVKELAEKNGEQTVDLRHEVMPAKEYDAYIKRKGEPKEDGFVSVWIDATHKTVIRETYQETLRYVIPRAGRRWGFPYGLSRASMIALPDARLLQQITLAIIEAAEKQINPPLIATSDVIRGDIRLESRGITWVDRAYDEKMGDPLRPIELGKNFRLGVDTAMRTEQQLMRAFKLDRIRYPDTRRSKTREEAAFLIDEFVRSAMPVFAPMKTEYIDEFLYQVDSLISHANGYNSVRPLPEELKETPLEFVWDNPITDMLGRSNAGKIAEAAQLAQTIASIDVAAQQSPALLQINTDRMVSAGMVSINAPDFVHDEETGQTRKQGAAQANQMREMVASAPNIAQVIKAGTDAAATAAEIPNQADPGYPLLPMPM